MSKGTSLMEVILVTAIVAVAGSLLVSILVNHTGFSNQQNSIINEGLSLNDAAGAINDNIRQTVAVATGYPAISPIYTTGDHVLVLKLPAVNGSGVISNVYDYAVVVAGNTSNVLRLLVFPDAQSTRKTQDKVLTNILDSVIFTYSDKSGNTVSPISAYQVGVSLTVLAKNGNVGSSRTSSTMTILRNFSQ